jgi:hypothetical protein
MGRISDTPIGQEDPEQWISSDILQAIDDWGEAEPVPPCKVKTESAEEISYTEAMIKQGL